MWDFGADHMINISALFDLIICIESVSFDCSLLG